MSEVKGENKTLGIANVAIIGCQVFVDYSGNVFPEPFKGYEWLSWKANSEWKEQRQEVF